MAKVSQGVPRRRACRVHSCLGPARAAAGTSREEADTAALRAVLLEQFAAEFPNAPLPTETDNYVADDDISSWEAKLKDAPAAVDAYAEAPSDDNKGKKPT